MKRRLKLIEGESEQPRDVTLLIREDIAKRDWSAVHVNGDRSRPLSIPDRIRRIWRG